MPLPFTVKQFTSKQSQYPERLRQAASPPELLYYVGDTTLLTKPAIAVVGSRNMSAYGEILIQRFIPSLVEAGLVIVSGLAYGVDAAAHQTALEHGGRCVAVLGSGLHNIYPARHQSLAEEITKKGCLLSEYSDYTSPKAYHFPARNRIIAALASVILIIEAGEKSGSFITARYALDCGREVCVIPADITRSSCAGGNQLLKAGARPITQVQDILDLYTHQQISIVESLKEQLVLTGLQSTLYDLVSRGFRTVPELAKRSGSSFQQVESHLIKLELDGLISNTSSQWQII